jgi:hypothetical protein
MTTTSDRRGIVLPVSSELTPAGLNQLVNGIKNLDNTNPWTECTSTTRPSSPYARQLIRETDTSRVYWWNGSGWSYLTNTNNITLSIWAMNVSTEVAGPSYTLWHPYIITGNYQRNDEAVTATAVTSSADNLGVNGPVYFSLPVATTPGKYLGTATVTNAQGVDVCHGSAFCQVDGNTGALSAGLGVKPYVLVGTGTTLTVNLFYSVI